MLPSGQNVPAGQTLGSDPPDGQKYPFGQFRQEVFEEAPTWPLYDPGEQFLGDDIPGVSQYDPAGHGMHDLLEFASFELP